MKKRRKKQQDAPKTVTSCYWAPKKRESAPFERTKDFKARIQLARTKSIRKKQEAQQRLLQKRGY